MANQELPFGKLRAPKKPYNYRFCFLRAQAPHVMFRERIYDGFRFTDRLYRVEAVRVSGLGFCAGGSSAHSRTLRARHMSIGSSLY